MASVSQFQRFMNVIRTLGASLFCLVSAAPNSPTGTRVEKEHMQYLKDSQRIEDRSGGANGSTPNLALGGTNVDFESLVGGGTANTKTASVISDSGKGWDDDVWGSLLADTPVQVSNALHIV